MKAVRVGVIGVGVLGRHHARLYGNCEGVELVGVYDNNDETARAVGEECGVLVFDAIADLAEAVDGLSVAVPTDRHHGIVLDLLQRGRHVLVQKTLAATVPAAEELVDAASCRGLILHVGHVERYNPVLECLDKVPGRVRFIESHRLAPYPPPRAGARPRGTEVSVVLDLMIHDLDVIMDLVQSEVTRIDAVGVPILSDSEDIANARLSFANGCVANVTASRVSAEGMRRIRVFKSNAYLSLDYHEQKGEIAYRAKGGIARESVPVRETNALQDELQDFVDCVRAVDAANGCSLPRVTGQHGLEAVRLAERIRASIAEHLDKD